MPLYHVPIEDLEDLVEELERSRLEKIQLVHNHPVSIGMLVVLTEKVEAVTYTADGIEVR